MSELGLWANHVIALTRGALRVWWRLLPLLLGTYALGWLGYQASLIGAAFISGRWPWLALVVLSLGFVSLLSATIICLRLLGLELGIRDNLPEGAVEDDRDTSIPRLLAITLLPFLGMYAAFGEVQKTANEVIAYEVVTRGIFETSVMAKLSPRTGREIAILAGVIVAVYLLRRVVDAIHDATDFRPLGLLAALIEGFMMLLLIFGGVGLLRRGWLWLIDRRVARWWQTVQEGFTTAVSRISEMIPDALSWMWLGLWHKVWPLFLSALAEPVVWLAVAALVYGSHVLSFAEMWRKGEPLSVHLDAQRHLRTRRAAAREQASGNRGRQVVLRIQELFFGDLDDKYLPTFQSLRLILRGGLVFLGAYVLVYTVVSTLGQLAANAIMGLFPPQDQAFWIAWKQLVDVISEPLAETLRLAVLAVAFARALQLFKATADPSAIGESKLVGTDMDSYAPLPAPTAPAAAAEPVAPAEQVRP
ncbi:hypothetical protein [Aestuariimicrobium ganziense]|uniref:hypothetical protein n=1 Tax=Aestuariimicrobium ganziense TaxID=2773677 RepID=UPI0019406CB0|nr:hypothetical protein [Aestuariimicrobium ganziense]